MNDELVEDLLKNPERNFARLLFETPPLTVIEILSDLVLHSDNGHNATLQCLYVWQDLQNNSYTLSSILEEIQNTHEVDIVCACLTLVNRLLQHAPDSLKRIRIRHELEEIQFEEHLSKASKHLVPNEQLKSLVEKFSFLLHQPASNCVTCVPIVDYIVGTTDADSGTFSGEDESDVMVGVENGLSSRVENGQKSNDESDNKITNEINTLISSFESEDALQLLARLLKQLHETKQPSTEVLKQLNENFSKLSEPSKLVSNGAPKSIPSAPPPPPMLNRSKVPPAPQLPSTSNNKVGPPPPPQLKSNIPPPPLNLQAPSTSKAKVEVPNALKPKFLPPDGKKLRHLQWTKIPLNNLATASNNSSNVWLKMEKIGADLIKNLDFAQLDSYFGCEIVAPETQLNGQNDKESKGMTVSLLCGKRSLSVNVFLKSMKGMVDDLISYIRSGHSNEDSNVERLKMLVPLLPTEEECQTLNNYTGNKEELGTAECFLLQLLSVPDYKLRIESIILREEFGAFIGTIEPDLRKLILACQELRQSRNLQTIMLILLHMGNYLNHNGALGNAVGFKLTSLWKIDELRAIKGGRTLLHLVSQQADKANASLDEISHVDGASKLAFEALKNELKTSVERVNKLENQLQMKTETFFVEMKVFLTESTQRLNRSNDLLTQIENERQQLAVYFCENEKTFSLEECFKIFNNFRNRFIIASNENRQREEREKRAQEKSLNGSVPEQQQSIHRNNNNVDSIKPPVTNRRSSVIVEQDRDRNSTSPIIQNRRKSSANRRESAIFDKFNFDQPKIGSQPVKTNNDLCSFVDQALESTNWIRPSRLSPSNSPLPIVTEFHETTNNLSENKEVDEVKVSVPTIDSRVENERTSIKQNDNENKQPIAEKNSPTVKSVNSTSKYSPPTSCANKTPTNGSLYSTTSLRKVPANLPKSTQPLNESQIKDNIPSSPLRKQDLSRIRVFQSNKPTQKPSTTPVLPPLRPSQVRMAQSRLPSNRAPLTTQSSTTSNSSINSRLSTIKNKVDPKPVTTNLRKTSTTRPQIAAIPSKTVTRNQPTVEKDKARASMSASEKRGLFRQNTSLSTTSRPTLIRTGSKTEKPRWS